MRSVDHSLCQHFYVFIAGFAECLEYSNPVLDTDHPDPGIIPLHDGSGYLGVLSSGNSPDTFPLMFSRDLVSWTPMGQVFPNKSWPDWAKSEMWAPEVHFVNDRSI